MKAPEYRELFLSLTSLTLSGHVMKQSGMIKICLSLIITLLSLNGFGDTIYCSQTDTLTLAYEYGEIVYYDSCDIQINDVLIIAPDCDVFIQILPVDSSFNFWLSRSVPHHCPPIPCTFDNYITKITDDGDYSAFEYMNIKYQTNFEVIKGDSSDMSIRVLPAQGNPPVYKLSINNGFEYYNWTNGSDSNFALIDTPGLYTVNAVTYFGDTLENIVSLDETGFLADQFFTGQKTGENVHYINLEPDSTAHYYNGGNIPPYKHILFDINQDNVNDLDFYVSFASGLGGYAAYFEVTPLNECKVLTIDNPRVTMNIDENCVVNNNFLYSGDENIMMYKESWILGSMGCGAGKWQDSDNYLGFRFPVNSDTLYGWIHILFSTSWGEMNLIIDDFAFCNNQAGVTGSKLDTHFSVYPNPVSSELFIKTQLPKFYVEVLNLSGTTIYYGQNTNRIDLSDISNGLYILKFSSEEENLFQKIIKQ